MLPNAGSSINAQHSCPSSSEDRVDGSVASIAFMFTNTQFLDLLRYRCLLPPILGDQAPYHRHCPFCAEGEFVDFEKHPSHMLSCKYVLHYHFP